MLILADRNCFQEFTDRTNAPITKLLANLQVTPRLGNPE